VPHGHWQDRENRRRYLRWLGRHLGFRTEAEWHGLTRGHFRRNGGGGLLVGVYNDSPYAALCDLMPRREWKPWLMSSTPQGFWRDPRNRVWFMDWLGEQLGFETVEDWHGLRRAHFEAHGGGGLLHRHYRGSPLEALKDYMPRVRWREWELGRVSAGFWQDPANRCWFLTWLGERLGFERPEDWYRLTARHVLEHGAGAMLRCYPTGHSVELLREYWPAHDWKPWLFHRVPQGYWEDRANQARYLRWLGRQLGFRSKADWYHLDPVHLRLTGGNCLLKRYHGRSLTRLLRTHFPRWRWDPEQFRRHQDLGLIDRLIEQDAVQAYRRDRAAA
jgi:hypothetical protein